MRTEVVINTDVLRKQIEAYGISEESLARRVGVKPENLHKWIAGEKKPTYRQAKKLARALNVSFIYLVTGLKPETALPIADLRTQPNAPPLSENSKAVIIDAYRKMEWLRERRISEGRSLLYFVGSCGLSNPVEVAGSIIKAFGLPESREFSSAEDYLKECVRKAEDRGIIVLRSAVVANNNRRKLCAEEFRGFAIADNVAPLVFVNADDELKAQIFTLFHELAHIWLGKNGISDVVETERNEIELFCNEVAAEILMPRETFLKEWREENIESISSYFKVSVYAVLVRALRLGLISREKYQELYELFYAGYQRRPKGGGGDFYNTLLARQSRSFTLEVLSAVGAGDIFYRDAARLLNINIGTVDRLLRRFGFVREPA